MLVMRAILLPLLLLLGACGDTLVVRGGTEVPSAASQYAGATDPGDPFEQLNRTMLDINTVADDSIFRPVAETYRAVVPEFGRMRIRAFLDNLGEPLIFANNLLQLRFEAAGTTFGRFALNTTLGGAGLFDVATTQGLTRQSGDFGQTLARYGLDHGPYLMLPVTGPTNLRDAAGDVVDGFGNPLMLALGPLFSAYTLGILNTTRGTLGGIDLRAENLDTLDILRADSLDYYARLRSVVRQRRDGELMALGRPSAMETMDDPGQTPPVLDDPGTASAAPAAQAVTAPARPRLPVEFVARTLRQADLATPGEAAGEALPGAVVADPAWARGVLQGAGLNGPRP
jgi:phospholipid-binding lipoprotein MlaA